MTTFATLFSGGELYGVGARQAGLTHLWGIEYIDDIAHVARLNGFNVLTADVMSVDPATLEVTDLLHASPVCKRASQANQSAELNEDGTKEALEDIDAGIKVAQFIDVLRPKFVTIENVYAYRNFRAFKIICAALDRGGYWWDYDNLNAADFGVPQTRKRLILRASRVVLLPNLPPPVKWVGWYEAIEDLIPTLRIKTLANWQLRLSQPNVPTLYDDQFSGPKNQDGIRNVVKVDWTCPAFTITTRLANKLRIYLDLQTTLALNPRCQARLQSVPDNYILPDKADLASTIIGNGVPCLLAETIVKQLVS